MRLTLYGALVLAAIVDIATAGPIVLDPMTVRGQRQELALRAIQSGLDNARSTRLEDANELVCWFESKTGSRLRHLFCATNDTLNESSEHAQRLALGMSGGRFGRAREEIYVSRFPVNRAQLLSNLERLGPVSVSRELLGRARAGESVPRAVPHRQELARFIGVLRAVSGASDAARARREALRDASMSERRFREIEALAAKLPSLATYVAEQL